MKRWTPWLLALAALLPACGSARQTAPLPVYIPLDTEAAEGEVLFMRHCHTCHPHGAAGIGLALNNKPLPAPVIRLQVREGVAGVAMPTFPPQVLSDAELDRIIAYLMAIRDL